MVRTAVRQLGTHIPRPRDAEKWEGKSRAQTKALNRSVSVLVAVLEPKEGDQRVHTLVLEQDLSLLSTFII